MRYAQIRHMDVTNGEGVGVALFVQGCPIHCKNCFNQEAWDFDGGKEWNNEVKEKFLKLANRDYINRISFLGGEPLCFDNESGVCEIIKEIKERFPNKKVWVYSGYTYDVLSIRRETEQPLNEILNMIDYLVDSPYVDEKKNISLEFRGSSNQRIIDMKQTREKHYLTLWNGALKNE